MIQAATLTTPTLRNGLSQKAWIEDQAPLLRGLKLAYLRATVIYEHILAEGRAQVVLDVRMKTLIGEHTQRELYELRRGPKGQWLIDSVQEYAENYLGFPI